MTLKELKDECDFYVNGGYSDSTVVVTTSDPSVGGRAGRGIRYISPGIDFESGQIRISLDKEVISKEKDRDRPMKAVRRVFERDDGRVRRYIFCPICDEKLRTSDKYCSNCGQSIDVGHYICVGEDISK